MKYNWIFTIILIALLTLIIYHLIVGEIRKRQRLERQRKKGEEGELSTALFLERVRGYKKILHHVYVPKEGGGTTEIDLVMIHEKGMIVIENKNYKGSIYGKEDDLYWRQVYDDGGKRSFYNPVRQNQSHIRHLRRLLENCGIGPLPYFSVITFNKEGSLRRIRVKKDTALITSTAKVRRRLKRRLRWLPKVLRKRQVDQLYDILMEEAGNTRKVRKKHEKQIHRDF